MVITPPTPLPDGGRESYDNERKKKGSIQSKERGKGKKNKGKREEQGVKRGKVS